MGCGSTSGKSFVLSRIFRGDEIALINKNKENKERDAGDSVSSLYNKIEIDFTQKEKVMKEYIVLFIPPNYAEDCIKYSYVPMIDCYSGFFESSEFAQFPKYAKKNNIKNSITRFEGSEGKKVEVDIQITNEDKENKIITLELGYNLNYKSYYGLYYVEFGDYGKIQQNTTYSFIINENFVIDNNELDDSCITKSNIFLFHYENRFSLTLRDKSVKLNIEDLLSSNILSKFTAEDIKQINFSLNEMPIEYDKNNVVYLKSIHQLTGKGKDNIKLYYVIFYPHLSGSYAICTGGSNSTKNKSKWCTCKKKRCR